jgi:putative ABC transport system permease protein
MAIVQQLESVVQDLKVAYRGMRRSPTFTIVAVLTLALGIGANAAVFAVTNAVLFKGFRLVDKNQRILYIGTQKDGRGCCASYPDFLDWRAQATSFSDMGAVADLQITLSDGGQSGSEHYDATQITTNGFRLLGQTPILGRDFAPADGRPGAAPVAILREAFWERRFGNDPAVVGRTVRINGTPTTVIGIMPRDFSFPQNTDLWLPLIRTADVDKREARGLWFAFGRLSDTATFEGARAELETIGRRLATMYPQTNDGWVPQPRTFTEFFVGRDARLVYGALWGAVGFVLLIACANLANLMLARASGRRRELVVRMAIGAGRGRIIQLLLVESLMLSALGAVVGWWIAKWSVRVYALTANPPARMWSADLLDYSTDVRVFVYLLSISVGAALLFGLAPMPYLSKVDVNGGLRDGARGSTGSRGQQLSDLLVVGEMALAVVLLAGAGVMVRSFLSMSTADLGVRTTQVTSMLVSLPQERYRDAVAEIAFFDRLTARLQATPGVESLAIANELPTASVRPMPYEIADDVPMDSQRRPTVSVLTIGPKYFSTLGVRLLAGRDFNDFDGVSGVPTAIVNQQFVNAYWPGQDPLGKRLRLFEGTSPTAWLTVVGVVSNVAQNTADRQARDPVVYRPYRQQPRRAMWVIVRAGTPLGSLAPAFRREVHAIDADLPIWIGPSAMNDLTAAMGNYWRLGVNAALLGVFAGVALFLAAIGLYAVVASSVHRRTQEIGIRIAIGATANDVRNFVFRLGILPSTIGLAIGLVASFAVTPVLKTQLVRVSPIDPMTLMATAAALMLAAILGCAFPAWRAMRVDPIVALRDD